jgi:hypothetical protein
VDPSDDDDNEAKGWQELQDEITASEDEVDLYDIILEERAKAYLETLSEHERGILDPDLDRETFWQEVARIQTRLQLDKDSAREVLNYILDKLNFCFLPPPF